MKTLRFFALAILAIALLTLGTLSVSAADPTNTGNPVVAEYIPTGTQTLAGYSEVWYRFDYDGSHTQMILRVPNAPSGLTVQVHNPASMTEWWSSTPIGVLSTEGDDLVWAGNSHEVGAYYVQVDNENAYAVSYNLVLTGDNIRTAPLPPVTEVSVPAAAAVETTLANIDPNKALPFDTNAHMIPGDTSLWYHFHYYGGTDRNQITIKMINGNNSGMGFKVWTPDAIAKWWENEPIGQGTPNGNDLLWSGSFNISDTYYVEVFNNNFYPLEFTLNFTSRKIY